MNRNVVILVVVGLVLCLCLAVVAVVVASLGGLAAITGVGGDYDAIVTLDSPVTVNQGDTFEIVITIENPTSSSIELDSIDVDTTYVEGIFITGSDPSYIDSTNYSTFQSLFFYYNIPANSTQVVRLQATAAQSGSFGGNFDVCINGALNCQGHSVRTAVNP